MNNKSYIELKENYLLVAASGVRRNFMDIIEGTIKIYEASKALKASRIFADYRQVSYEVSMVEAFNLVRYYEKKLPEFYDMSMAVLINPRDMEIAKFWEGLCKKRGFNIAVFTDPKLAEKWLLQQPVNQS